MRNGRSVGSLPLAFALAVVCAAGCNGVVGAKMGDKTAGIGGSGDAVASGAGGAGGAGNAIASGVGGAGNVGVTGAGGAGNAIACATATPDAAPSVLRRLSNLEYKLTLQDLFQLSSAPAVDAIPPDVDREGFKIFASLQTVSAQHLRAYIDRAHGLADELMADATRRAKVLGCEPTASGCLRTFVTKFGKLAFRRPLETAEVDAVVNRATADALDTTDQFRFAIEVLLSSPSFLYRVEVGPASDPLATLTKYELAARLSFLLWGRAPDATLLDQAAAGALDSAAGLDATMTAMLADARTRTFYEAFFQQWLGFDGLPAPPNPPSGWSQALLTDMTRETQQVVGDFAWGGKNLLDVLTANYTRPTAALSSYYGLPAAAADGTAPFPASHPRANTGLLTHPSLLAAKRDGDLIAIRGNWLRRTFLCKSLSIPADVAEMLGDMLVGLNRVQIVQKRNSESACMGCHGYIDPIGIGFVQFDQTGRYDATINGAEYGLASALPDAAPNASFSTLAELATKLHGMPEVSACLAQKVFTYANGREPLAADRCTVAAAADAFAGGGNSFPELLAGLIDAPAFRLRRAPEVTP